MLLGELLVVAVIHLLLVGRGIDRVASIAVDDHVEHLTGRRPRLLLVYREAAIRVLDILMHLRGMNRLVLISHHLIMLQAVQLVMLQQARLLHHRLIRLREEIVFLNIALTRRTHLSQVSLQELASHSFLLCMMLCGRHL